MTNTNKEAIEILKTESCADCSCHPGSPISCINTKCSLIGATLLAIKALEFQDNVKEAYYSSSSGFEFKNYIRELLKGGRGL